MCILKDIPNFEGRYMASDDGHIWGCVKGDYLSERRTKDGYLSVDLYIEGRKKRFFVHRLVAMTFIPNPENKATVNHINEIKADNRVTNLEWMTNMENVRYGTGQLRATIANVKRKFEQGKKVKQLTLDGKFIRTFESIKETCRVTGVERNALKKCLNGVWHKSHNYKWEYV